MADFICKSKDGERKLCYSPSAGKTRIYRSSGEKHLKTKLFKNKFAAQRLCDEVNSKYNDDFEVVEFEPGQPAS